MKILLFLRTFILFGVLPSTVHLLEIYQEWGSWFSYSTAPTRERVRDCYTDEIVCTSNHVKEVYTNCSDECDGGSFLFSNGSVCNGTCDLGQATQSFRCNTSYSPCTLLQVYNCINEDSCTGTWSLWADTGYCNRFCDSGNITQERICIHELGANVIACLGGLGNATQTTLTSCNTFACPVFSSWSAFSSCSATCHGEKMRIRDCFVANKLSNNVSEGCGSEATMQVEHCRPLTCPEYTKSTNNSCSVECGGGAVTIIDFCTFQGAPSTLCYGADPDGMRTRIQKCNEERCPDTLSTISATGAFVGPITSVVPILLIIVSTLRKLQKGGTDSALKEGAGSEDEQHKLSHEKGSLQSDENNQKADSKSLGTGAKKETARSKTTATGLKDVSKTMFRKALSFIQKPSKVNDILLNTI
ncbi:unnamed protein product [Clavelina lepadiformis]|uniref:Uncharacterized protein n=1 Tax=Clavelina lepadiformis TaxID=159417 RepID=A0ABP0F1Z5_CLALP